MQTLAKMTLAKNPETREFVLRYSVFPRGRKPVTHLNCSNTHCWSFVFSETTILNRKKEEELNRKWTDR